MTVAARSFDRCGDPSWVEPLVLINLTDVDRGKNYKFWTHRVIPSGRRRCLCESSPGSPPGSGRWQRRAAAPCWPAASLRAEPPPCCQGQRSREAHLDSSASVLQAWARLSPHSAATPCHPCRTRPTRWEPPRVKDLRENRRGGGVRDKQEWFIKCF